MRFVNAFFSFCVLCFHSFGSNFQRAENFNFNKVQFNQVLINNAFCLAYPRNQCLISVAKVFFLCFFNFFFISTSLLRYNLHIINYTVEKFWHNVYTHHITTVEIMYSSPLIISCCLFVILPFHLSPSTSLSQ